MNMYMSLINERSINNKSPFKAKAMNTFLYQRLQGRGVEAATEWIKVSAPNGMESSFMFSEVCFHGVALLNFTIIFCHFKEDLLQYNIIVVPIHLGAHWCLATISPQRKMIEYFDSLQEKTDASKELSAINKRQANQSMDVSLLMK